MRKAELDGIKAGDEVAILRDGSTHIATVDRITATQITAGIAERYPWRPAAEGMPRNVVIQLRLPSDKLPVTRIAVVNDVGRFGAAVEYTSIAQWHSEDPIMRCMTGDRKTLADLIAAGAQWRELP